MGKFKAISLASLGAVAVQPAVFLAWLGLPALLAGQFSAFFDVARYSFIPAIFAVPFVLFIGVPVTLLLAHYGKLRWWPLGLIGALAASLPVALSTPGGGPGFSSAGNWYGRHVDFVVNGDPTLYGWLSYLQSIAFFGLHGLAGATVFYFMLRRCMGPNYAFKRTAGRGFDVS